MTSRMDLSAYCHNVTLQCVNDMFVGGRLLFACFNRKTKWQ